MVFNSKKFKSDVFLWAVTNDSTQFIFLGLQVVIKNLNIATGDLKKSGNNLDKGSFTGPIMSQDGDNAFLFDGERHVL